MKYLTGPLAILSFAALVACGGGGGTTDFPAIPDPNASPTSLPSPGVTTAPAGSSRMTVSIPHRAANSNVTTPASPTKIVAIINKLNGSSTLPGTVSPRTQIDLTNTSAATCTSPGPCSFTMPAPAGSLNVTITVYAGANPLATDTLTYTSTGAAGQTQSDSLKAIVANVTLPPINVQFNTPSSNELIITAQDPSGATIIDGSYANAVNLSLTGGSSTTGLQLIGSSTGPQSAVVLSAPSDRVQLIYDGNAIPTGINYTTASYTAAQTLTK